MSVWTAVFWHEMRSIGGIRVLLGGTRIDEALDYVADQRTGSLDAKYVHSRLICSARPADVMEIRSSIMRSYSSCVMAHRLKKRGIPPDREH
jgi:hypothetical protein